MTLDKNNKIIEIGDIVKIAGSPNKSDNAIYIVAQDGTSEFYSSSDLTLYKAAKHKNGYTLSRGSYNICFYPLCNFSSKYKYTREEMNAATIEILVKNNPSKIEIIKNDNKYENCEEGKEKDLYYRCTINTTEGKQIEDVSYLCAQAEKLQAFLSNISLKADEEIEILKACNTDFYYARSEYRADYKEGEMQELEAAETVSENTEKEEPQEEATAIENVERKYYEINENMARLAKNMNSFSGYEQDSATEEYKGYCDRIYDIVDKIINRKPEHAGKAVYMADRYAKKLAEYYNDYYRNEAYCPSIMISGGSNFPVRKKEKQNSRRATLNDTWNYLKDYAKKIENLLCYEQAIKSNDENVIELLERKIEQLEAEHKHKLYCNKYYKKNGTLKGCEGLTEAQIEKVEDFIKRNPYCVPFVVCNDTANIRRYKDRLEGLKKAKEKGTTEATATNTEGNEFFKIVENVELMRLQLLFDGVPAEEVRNVLKKNGFKWSPKNKAWQRQLTDNAKYSLKRIKEELKIA